MGYYDGGINASRIEETVKKVGTAVLADQESLANDPINWIVIVLFFVGIIIGAVTYIFSFSKCTDPPQKKKQKQILNCFWKKLLFAIFVFVTYTLFIYVSYSFYIAKYHPMAVAELSIFKNIKQAVNNMF